MIIIQFITVHWSKHSRGAPHSTLRNSVPEAFSLPQALTPNATKLFLHEINVYESRQFKEPKHTVSRNVGYSHLRELGLQLEVGKDQTVVYYWGDIKRPSYPKARRVFSLTPVQYGRIVSNARFSGETTWFYQKHVCNIHFGQENVPLHYFENNQPNFSFRDEVDLW